MGRRREKGIGCKGKAETYWRRKLKGQLLKERGTGGTEERKGK